MQRVTQYDNIAGIFKIDAERHSNIVQETGQYENVIENIMQLRKEYAENKISEKEAWSLTLELLNNYED
jgi:5'-3' exonuclease